MAQATISARIDANDKAQFDHFCEEVGLTTSALLNVFIKKVIRENRIPFSIDSDPFYSKSNMDFLKEGIAALNDGKGIPHELIENEE